MKDKVSRKHIIKQTDKELKAWENEIRSQMIKKRTYIKCQKCGWVHFIAPDIDAPWSCFKCGNEDKNSLVQALKDELPVGSTIQPINRIVRNKMQKKRNR